MAKRGCGRNVGECFMNVSYLLLFIVKEFMLVGPSFSPHFGQNFELSGADSWQRLHNILA